MTTRIELTAAEGHRPDIRFATGLLSPRRMRAGDEGVRVALVAASALLLAGDHVRIEVLVDGPVQLDVVENAGTVAYDMRGGRATWDVDVVLRRGASLTWTGEPFVVSAGADVARSLTLSLGAGCRAAVLESLALGRSGETGGALRTSTRVHVQGRPLVVEDLDLGPAARTGWAVLGSHRCLQTVTTLGFRLPDPTADQVTGEPLPGATVLQAQGPATIVRRTGDHTHATGLAAAWRAARDAVTGQPVGV